MTATPTRPATARSVVTALRSAGFRLAELLTDLDTLGLCGQEVIVTCSGDADVRLQVRRAGIPVTVELLWSYAGGPPPRRLHAVRIADGQRQVWRHHAERCTRADAARFVTELVTLTDADLRQRYRLVG